MKNFWEKLNRPFFCLAPMQDVTDMAFREMFAEYGKADLALPKRDGPDVMFTEFVSVDGLLNPEGRKRLMADLQYTKEQRPIVAQIWGRDPEKFRQAAQILVELGFDGIDINMGCPQDKEIALKTCAALIKEPELAQKIISATKQGAGLLPVSVKTRIGYSQNTVEEWIRQLLEVQPAAIAIHARTKTQKSKVPADWQAISRAVKIRNQAKSSTLIVGNGDIKSRPEGLNRAAQSGADGVMVGRGVFGNPWFFRIDGYQPSLEEKFQAMLRHAKLFVEYLGEQKTFLQMRKHLKAYVGGLSGAGALRAALMRVNNLAELQEVIEEYELTQADAR